jgi:hypothetical protein
MLVLTLAGLPLSVFCQNDTVPAKHEKAHSLYAGFNFGSNLIYLGSTISGNKPYYSPSLIYGFKDMLFLSASATHVTDMNPYIAFGSISASFTKTVNSWFDYSASLGYYGTADSLQKTLFQSFGYANITTGFDWKILYTKISLSGVMSETNSGYVEIRNSHYFQTGQFFNKKAFLSFDPSINILFGKLVKTEETTTGSSKFGHAPPFVQAKKNQNNTTTTYTYSYFFGMMSTEFSVPITLNFSNFSLEAETLYVLPVHSDPEYPSPEGFSLNITALIKIF